MKKFLKILGIMISTLVLALVIASIILFQRPSVKFLLIMTDIYNPSGYTTKETTINTGKSEISLLVYEPIKNKKSDSYYFLLHGMTPQAATHPALKKIAIALMDTTGRTIFIPHVKGSVSGNRTMKELADEIAGIYLTLRENHPGSYHTFGACIAGTGLLIAFNTIPSELYPEKFFLYGPFFRGEDLIASYNKSGMEIDFLVRMANALNSDSFSREEKTLISKAIAASKPGTTDKKAMRHILGDALYEKTEKAEIYNEDIMSINETSIFSPNKKIPETTIYIIHSTSDNIVPFIAGQSLHRFLKSSGLKSKFLCTKVFSHTQIDISFINTMREILDILEFLDEILEDTEQ